MAILDCRVLRESQMSGEGAKRRGPCCGHTHHLDAWSGLLGRTKVGKQKRTGLLSLVSSRECLTLPSHEWRSSDLAGMQRRHVFAKKMTRDC